VIGCRDPFLQVNGKGIEKLKAAGIEVEIGVLEKECIDLNRRFFVFHTHHRPYVVLKWAQTHDRFIAGYSASRLKISNQYTDRLVHKWRSEEAGILVGTNTAVNDDPKLNTRLWPGKNPVRIIIDMNGRLPGWLKVFDGTIPTIVFNRHEHTLPFEKLSAYTLTGVQYYQVTEDVSIGHQLLNGLYRLGIQSIIVEGGAQLLQSFIDEDTWDEARVITNEELQIEKGLSAPTLRNAGLINTEPVFSDVIRTYKRLQS
jgi:diaminohydroxyphosphoribosylaminopyrimidine deaminase/5-amino-6-(5-phosphoribosylamino)uracil reductase